MSEPTDREPAATPKGTIIISAVIPSSEKPGDKIGRYKLLQEIGEGGMGTVWMAEQEEPVRRRVALKVIKLGMDTKQVIGRFEAERQALALMDHPNIAKVLDAGMTGNGRPFFVMELVRGISITQYCDDNKLGTLERLNLFTEVCRAVQHAHQKGIIHRDIKPSNILVTSSDGTPVPKVIDFGIAKATGGQVLTDKTVFTAFEQFIGTPAYMSPEQAEMNALDIDTRTDIYSLGVLLYELLTGKTPLDSKELVAAGLDGMRRLIREKEPERPSTRISMLDAGEQTTVANSRHAEPPKLIHLIRGDLDWIAMKCLEKDRTRRYDTANGLAMDIERHLKNEPVVACPPSNLYRFKKLVRRNKLAFAAAALVTFSLVIGLGAVSRMLLREREARMVQARLRQEAEAARASEAISSGKAETRAKIIQAKTLHDAAHYEEAEKLLDEIPLSALEQDAAHAALRRDLGCWYARQGFWRRAIANFVILLRLDELDELNPKDDTDTYGNTMTFDYLLYGPALIELKDKTAYESFRQSVVEHLARTTDSVVAERLCKVSLLLPAEQKLMIPLGPLYAVAAQRQEDPKLLLEKKNWACISLALVDYRRTNYQKSIEWCQLCLSSPLQNAARKSTAEIILAMSNQRLNQHADAQKELTQAAATIDEAFQKGGKAYSEKPAVLFFDWMFARILLREALAVVGEPSELGKVLVTEAKKKAQTVRRIVTACDGRVCVSPGLPATTASVFIQFYPAGGNLASANLVRIHFGWSNWIPVVSPDVAMVFNSQSNCWQHTVAIPTDATQLDCVFNNGAETWDNNSGTDWHFATAIDRTP